MHHRGQLHCGKRRFRDPREAKVALMLAKRSGARERETQGDSTRAERRWYLCGRCNGYHLTSQPLGVDLLLAA